MYIFHIYVYVHTQAYRYAFKHDSWSIPVYLSGRLQLLILHTHPGESIVSQCCPFLRLYVRH